MNNRPFFSTNTNVYDQSIFSAAPTNFNGQNVLVSQEQQRQVFDTLNSSIVGLPFETPRVPIPSPGQFVQAQKHFVPGGVLFSFTPQPVPQHPQSYAMMCCPCPSPTYYPISLEQQIAANGLQKHGLESLHYQQQLANNPFQLIFHHNISTSCSDLLNGPMGQVPGSRSFPDFTNISGAVNLANQKHGNNMETSEQCYDWLTRPEYSAPTCNSSRNIKRLNLSKQPEPESRQVTEAEKSTDVIGNKKKVNFADEQKEGDMKKEDKSSQISCRCSCDDESVKDKKGKSKPKSKQKEKKISKTKSKSKKGKESTTESSTESSQEDEISCCACNLDIRKIKDDKTDSQYTSSGISE